MKFALIYFFHNNAIEICRSDSILGYENEENPLIRVNEIVRVWCRPRQKRKSSSNTNSNSSLEAENNKCVELDINTTTSSNSTSNVRIENVSTFAAKVLAVADTREVLLHVDVSEDILGGGALSGSIDESCKKKTCLDEDISERKLDTKYDLKDIKVEIETKYACDNSFKTNLLSNSVYEIFDSGEENLRSGALSGSTDEACKKETCLDEDISERKLDTKYDLKDLKVEIETKYACDNSFKTNLLSNSVCEIFDSKEENSDSKSMMEIVKTEESCVSALSQDEVLHKKEETETTKDKESAADSFISRKRCKESRIQTMFMKEGKKKTSHGEEPTMQSSVSKTQTSIQLLREKEDARDCSNKTSVSMNDTNKTEGRKLRTRHKVYTENKSDDEEERLSCDDEENRLSCDDEEEGLSCDDEEEQLSCDDEEEQLSCDDDEEQLSCDKRGKDYKNKKQLKKHCIKKGKNKTSHGEEPIIQSSVPKTQTSIQLLREKEDARDCSNKTSVSMNDTNKTEGRKLRTRHKIYTENKSDEEEDLLSCDDEEYRLSCDDEEEGLSCDDEEEQLSCDDEEEQLSCDDDEEQLSCDKHGKDYKNKKQLKKHCIKKGKNKTSHDEEPIIQSSVSKTQTCIQLLREKEDARDCSNKTSVSMNDTNKTEGRKLRTRHKVYTENKSDDEEERLSCGECGKDYKNKKQLRRHLLIHKRTKLLSCGEEERLKCDECGKDYKNKKQLKRHLLIHKRTKLLSCGEEERLKCDECGKDFINKKSLWNHQLIHRKSKLFSCNVCGRAFKLLPYLKNHSVIHRKKKPYCCDVCGRRFAQKFALISHRKIHTGEKPYECNICHKKFRQNTNLKCHIMIHTGEKPYSCNVCDKAYRSHSHLKSHKLTHKGEKPFKCDVCGKKFTRVFVLRQHQLVHTGEKPYGCDVCKKTFRQKAHLRSHLLRHKNEK